MLQDVDGAEVNNLTVRSAFGGVSIIRGSGHAISGLDLVDSRLKVGLFVDGANVAARRVDFPIGSFVPVAGTNITVGLDDVTFGEHEHWQPAVVMKRLEFRGFPAEGSDTDGSPRLTHRLAPPERPERDGVTLYLPYEWKTGGVAILNINLERTHKRIRPSANDRISTWDRVFSYFQPPDTAAGSPIRIVLERTE